MDGTLWDFENYIPDSTREAIWRLRENGHKVFICSGRTRSFIQDPKLLSLGFDGIVCGCGTRIEYKEELLFERTLAQEDISAAVSVFKEQGMTAVMEGNECFYADLEELKKDKFGRLFIASAGEIIYEVSEYEGKWNASKFTVLLNGHDSAPAVDALGDRFDFIIHDAHVMEVVQKGYSKGTGIRHVCELLNIEVSDTFAFGDSANDLEMLDTAGTAVVMGNGSDIAKSHADYVTDELKKDGIYNACLHFGLI